PPPSLSNDSDSVLDDQGQQPDLQDSSSLSNQEQVNFIMADQPIPLSRAQTRSYLDSYSGLLGPYKPPQETPTAPGSQSNQIPSEDSIPPQSQDPPDSSPPKPEIISPPGRGYSLIRHQPGALGILPTPPPFLSRHGPTVPPLLSSGHEPFFLTFPPSLPSEHSCHPSAPLWGLPSEHSCYPSSPLLSLPSEHLCHPSAPILIFPPRHRPSPPTPLSPSRHGPSRYTWQKAKPKFTKLRSCWKWKPRNPQPAGRPSATTL